jgi:hypothetical protein
VTLAPTAELLLLGQTAEGFDDRPYHQVVSDAVSEVNAKCLGLAAERLGPDNTAFTGLPTAEVHRTLRHEAVQLGYLEGAEPKNRAEGIKALAGVYREHRAWVRERLAAYLERFLEETDHMIDDALAAKADAAPEAETPLLDAPRGREPGEDG